MSSFIPSPFFPLRFTFEHATIVLSHHRTSFYLPHEHQRCPRNQQSKLKKREKNTHASFLSFPWEKKWVDIHARRGNGPPWKPATAAHKCSEKIQQTTSSSRSRMTLSNSKKRVEKKKRDARDHHERVHVVKTRAQLALLGGYVRLGTSRACANGVHQSKNP